MCMILLQAEDAPEGSISRPTYVNLQEVTLHSNMDSDPPHNEYAPLDLRTRSWEVAREDVIVEKIIGKGAFGQVAKGTAKNLSLSSGTRNVAIKMLKGSNQYIARNSEPLPLAKRDETLPCALFLFIGKCMEMIV